jgi:hypothetical protein
MTHVLSLCRAGLPYSLGRTRLRTNDREVRSGSGYYCIMPVPRHLSKGHPSHGLPYAQSDLQSGVVVISRRARGRWRDVGRSEVGRRRTSCTAALVLHTAVRTESDGGWPFKPPRCANCAAGAHTMRARVNTPKQAAQLGCLQRGPALAPRTPSLVLTLQHRGRHANHALFVKASPPACMNSRPLAIGRCALGIRQSAHSCSLGLEAGPAAGSRTAAAKRFVIPPRYEWPQPQGIQQNSTAS